MHTNFAFLKNEFPILANLAESAEYNVYSDPVTALFKLRQFGETYVHILFDEHGMELPRESTFHNCLKKLEYNDDSTDILKEIEKYKTSLEKKNLGKKSKLKENNFNMAAKD